MSGINKCIFIGRAGKDPEVKTTTNSTLANFSIAVSESWKDKNGEKKESTEWINVVVWGKLAEIVSQYVRKGMLVYIEGKLKTESWEKDGITRYATKIQADTVQMLSRPEGQSAPAPAPATGKWEEVKTEYPGNPTDELPF